MLKIFTSYTPGAGKSYAMLEKAMAEQAKGKKVLIGNYDYIGTMELKVAYNTFFLGVVAIKSFK